MRILDREIPSLKIGDVIYECEAGMNIEARITQAPTETVGADGCRQWLWKAINTQCDEEINYLLTEGLSHYGPRLYREPQYCQFVDGEVFFPLVGAAPTSVGTA